ncbi:MAG: VWA domain-containing protein [Candidatus Hydrogenedentes bacterium]|nr:VWA domain-containing protein [Candidatus Hydrogenedentota bacterium]
MSIVLSVMLHGALIALAPTVPMLRIYAPAPEMVQRFKVRVSADVPPLVKEETPDPTQELATRPGSIEELLTREKEELRPSESVIDEEVSIPDLAKRVVTESLTREYALEVDEAIMKKVDARIIEVSQETARQAIQIARRHVRPSPLRLLEEDEFPTMRAPDAEMPKELLTLDPLKTGGGLGGVGDGSGLGDGRGQGGDAPEKEELPVPGSEDELAPPEDKLASLPAETVVAREDEMAKATAEAKEKYEFLDDLVDIQIATYRPKDEPTGYFRLSIVPKAGESIDVLPKDVTFVVDASSSIAQPKLDSTIKGLREALNRLRPEDRFNLIVFRNTATGLERGFVNATPEKKEAALRFVQDLRSYGKTDVYSAMGPVVEKTSREGIPGVVFLISDGRPSAGMLDSRAIINAVTDKNRPRNTVLAFGGGNTVNQYLLDLLAFRNKGYSYVSPSWNDIPSDLPQFFGTVSDPILVDCQADFGRIAEESVFPKELPDFFKGQGVIVYGRYDPEKNKDFAMRLTGVAGSRNKEVVFRANLEEAETGDESIAKDWALRKIYYLIGEMTRVGPQPELVTELDRLHKEYGLKTSYSN